MCANLLAHKTLASSSSKEATFWAAAIPGTPELLEYGCAFLRRYPFLVGLKPLGGGGGEGCLEKDEPPLCERS